MNPPPPIMQIDNGVIGFPSRFAFAIVVVCGVREKKEREKGEREKKVWKLVKKWLFSRLNEEGTENTSVALS